MGADGAAVLAALDLGAARTPDAPAVVDAGGTWSYAGLTQAVDGLVPRFAAFRGHGVALRLENGAAWAACDLAALRAGTPLVPLPGFFSPSQTRHVLADSGVAAVIGDRPDRLADLGTPEPLGPAAGRDLWQVALPAARPLLPAGCAKVTYTSGTTGTPKGVLLRQAALERVAASLVEAVAVGEGDRHLAVLPLSLLLENIAGLYTPLLAGASVVLRPTADLGLNGSTGVEPARLWSALAEAGATTTILTPQLLQALVEYAEREDPAPLALRFAAVGGARVPARLLARARERGLPAYEGYGLSECASVVAVNRPGADRVGSVGRPLPHVRVRTAADGELWVRGAHGDGYLGGGGPARVDGFWPTGDLGYQDEDGFLHLLGRKRQVYITAYGRNVAPEWVEDELTGEPAIAQAAVFGEARPTNGAVIWSADDDAAVAEGIAAVNARLPDYARIAFWVRADRPFTAADGLLTETGRPGRAAIFAAYREALGARWGGTETDGTTETEETWASTSN